MNHQSHEGLTLTAEQLSAEAYREFGEVLSAGGGKSPFKANRGTANLFDRLTTVENLRPGIATQNWKLYRCTPCLERPVRILELEKHPSSTQLFVPMGAAGRYLVVVALGDATPDLASLRAFVAINRQAITYKPGIWHLPMTVLDVESDMLSLVYEDSTTGDCVTAELKSHEIRVTVMQ